MKLQSMIVLCVLALVSSLLRADDPPTQAVKDAKKPLITISKETTHITEPLTEDGQVDYFKAFDQHMRAGVTPENNAGVLIALAFGPEVIEEPMREEFFGRLGIVVPTSGQFFLSLETYLSTRDPYGQFDPLRERLRQLCSEPWKPADEPVLHDWIISNEEALARLSEASQRKKLYIPTLLASADGEEATPKVISMLLPVTQELREAARALVARAMLRLGEGDTKGARADLLTVHRLAHLVGQSPLLIVKLVSYSLEAMACSGECAVAQHEGLSAAEALQAREAIEHLPPVTGPLDAFDIGERYAFLDAAQTIAHGGTDSLNSMFGQSKKRGRSAWGSIPIGAAINYDVVLRMGNEMFDRLAAASREPDPEKRAAMYLEIENSLEQRAENASSAKSLAFSLLSGRLRDDMGNKMGNILLSLLVPAFRAVDQAETRTNAYRDLARVAMALAAFRAEHNKYPQTLDELAGKYLDKVPADRFARQSLHYKTANGNYLLYSVGPNGEDDGGRDYHAQPPADDLVVEHVQSSR